jgi:hypothetical protein
MPGGSGPSAGAARINFCEPRVTKEAAPRVYPISQPENEFRAYKESLIRRACFLWYL